jgi:hypothetical protein
MKKRVFIQEMWAERDGPAWVQHGKGYLDEEQRQFHFMQYRENPWRPPWDSKEFTDYEVRLIGAALNRAIDRGDDLTKFRREKM